MKAELHLSDPSPAELEAAYRGLDQPRMVTVSCPTTALAEVLAAMEVVGFVAMTVHRTSLAGATARVAGVKAKAGPCHDGGRRAAYRGAARAVLDDDNHLLVGELAVCEKTARVYGLEPYAGLVEVTGGDDALLARLDADPAVFDCNTYEDDLRRLLDDLPAEPPPTTATVALFYPGPFRLLVLADGHLLRRGEAALVPAALAAALVAADGCLELGADSGIGARPAAWLPRLVAERGSGALLGELPLAPLEVTPRALDLDAVDALSPAFARRLAEIIDHGDPMLVLTGSDPRDELGCCPSEEVGEALGLVEAGVLSAFRAPAPAEACPVTVLAFAGEMEVVDGRPAFTTDHELRARVRARLGGTDPAPSGGGPSGRTLLTWLLLTFVGLSLAMASIQVTRAMTAAPPPLAEVIAASADDEVVLCLFHPARRCDLCRRLEAGARGALDHHLAAEVAAGRVRLTTVDLDRPGHEAFKREHVAFSSSLVVIALEEGRVVDAETLTGAWSLAETPEALAAHIARAVETALGSDPAEPSGRDG